MELSVAGQEAIDRVIISHFQEESDDDLSFVCRIDSQKVVHFLDLRIDEPYLVKEDEQGFLLNCLCVAVGRTKGDEEGLAATEPAVVLNNISFVTLSNDVLMFTGKCSWQKF